MSNYELVFPNSMTSKCSALVYAVVELLNSM